VPWNDPQRYNDATNAVGPRPTLEIAPSDVSLGQSLLPPRFSSSLSCLWLVLHGGESSSRAVRGGRPALNGADADAAGDGVDIEKNAVVADTAAEAVTVVLRESLDVAAERVGGHSEQGRIDAVEVARRQPIELLLGGLVDDDQPAGRRARIGTAHRG